MDPVGMSVNQHFKHVPLGQPKSNAIPILNLEYSACLSIGNHEHSILTLNSILCKNYGFLADSFAVYPVELDFLHIEQLYRENMKPMPPKMAISALKQATNNSEHILPVNNAGKLLSGAQNIEYNRNKQQLDIDAWKRHLKTTGYNSVFNNVGAFVCLPLLSMYPNWESELKSQYTGTFGGDIGGIAFPVPVDPNTDVSQQCESDWECEESCEESSHNGQ
jgi:hypothetical protein